MRPFRWKVPLSIAVVLATAVAPRASSADDHASGLDSLRAMVDSGELVRAETWARELLEESEEASPPDSLTMALVLDQLAVILRRTGRERTPEAEAVCERALTIKRMTVGAEHESYAASLNALGTLFYYRMEYSRAIPLITRAYEIRRARLGEDHPDVAWCLMTLGAIESDTGSDSIAVSMIERAVAIQRRRPDTKEFDRILAVNALATIRSRLGDYTGAAALYEEALTLLQRGGNRNEAQVATCYHNLGVLQLELYDLPSARESLERALKLRRKNLGKDHPMVAYTLMALGGLRKEQGDLAGARSHYEAALRIFLSAYGPANAEVGWVKGKLGWVALDQGRANEAAPLLRESVEVQERALGRDHPSLWNAILGLAEVSARSGDPLGAERSFGRVESLLVNAYGSRYPDLGEVLARHAAFLETQGQSTRALDLALRSAAIAREQVRLAARGFAERQVLAYSDRSKGALDLALSIVARHPSAEGSVERVWDELIRSRGLVLDEMAMRNRYTRADSLQPEWDRLRRSRQALAGLLVRGTGSDSSDLYRRKVEAARASVETAERQLARASASFRATLTLEHAGLGDVARTLSKGDGLIAYAVYGKGASTNYLAFVLIPDGKPFVVPLGSANEMDRCIEAWRKEASRTPDPGRAPAEEAACRSTGRQLRKRAWDPIEKHLRGARRVFLVPDGDLHGVSFAAFPDEQGGYLIESGPTLHDLSAERDVTTGEGPRGRGLLAVGGIDFDRNDTEAKRWAGGSTETTSVSSGDCAEFASISFPPLPDSEREIETVSKLWNPPGDVVLLTGAKATERAFSRAGAGKRVIHLATHGFAMVEECGVVAASVPGVRGIGGTVPSTRVRGATHGAPNPLRLSGLVLAGANRRISTTSAEDDGILTAEEIASMDLSGVEWAVLSSCDTGTGDFVAREGVLGLSRAFRAAQVGTLIVSLWHVEDSFARTWMTLLYDARFQRGLATGEAVREATLRVLRDRRTQGKSTHPFHWAAFEAVGSWN